MPTGMSESVVGTLSPTTSASAAAQRRAKAARTIAIRCGMPRAGTSGAARSRWEEVAMPGESFQ